MFNYLNIIFILSILLSFLSCSDKVPVTEKELILIYTDLMFAQDTLLVTSKNVDSLKSIVFNRHNITEDEYRSAIEAINRTPERWEQFFNKVIEYVESLRSKPATRENISFWPLQYVKVQN